jgi:transcriptional regulator with XRE-family HTH domain
MCYNILIISKARTYSPLNRHAAREFGQRIRLGRLERKWTAENLAERVGVSRRTISNLEAGDLSVALGTVFEAAVLTGVPLFTEDENEMGRLMEETRLRLAVLPARARRAKIEDEEF